MVPREAALILQQIFSPELVVRVVFISSEIGNIILTLKVNTAILQSGCQKTRFVPTWTTSTFWFLLMLKQFSDMRTM